MKDIHKYYIFIIIHHINTHFYIINMDRLMLTLAYMYMDSKKIKTIPKKKKKEPTAVRKSNKRVRGASKKGKGPLNLFHSLAPSTLSPPNPSFFALPLFWLEYMELSS